MASHIPNPAAPSDQAEGAGIPGSPTAAHPTDGIPLPPHGLRRLADLDEPAGGPTDGTAAEAISAAAVVLLNAAAKRLGLVPGAEPDLDLVEARQLIDALAALVAAAQDGLGSAAQPLLDGVRTLQEAFREAAARPDPVGAGPGERFLP